MASQKMGKAKAAGSKQKRPVTTAIHVESEDGNDHFVGIGNLRVMLFNDDGSWFAQGLEIDYFAQGDTIENAQERFQTGLRATIDYHLRVYGGIERLLEVAPPETWKEFLQARKVKSLTQVSFHSGVAGYLPFSGVAYYERAAA